MIIYICYENRYKKIDWEWLMIYSLLLGAVRSSAILNLQFLHFVSSFIYINLITMVNHNDLIVSFWINIKLQKIYDIIFFNILYLRSLRFNVYKNDNMIIDILIHFKIILELYEKNRHFMNILYNFNKVNLC